MRYQISLFVIAALALFVAVTTVDGQSCAAVPANTISWWAGEGDGLDTLGSNPGTLMNGVGFAPGKAGQAFSFDGIDDYVNVPHSTSLDLAPAQPASFVVWVKRTSANDVATIFAKRPDCGTQVHYLLQWYGPGNWFVFGSTGAPTNGVGTTADKLPLNEWTMVAVSFDGTTATMYINGEPVASHAMAFDPNTVPLAIGGEPPCGDYFGGLIDNFIIVKRAMTQTEIQSIYNAGTSGICSSCSTPPSGMISWWPGDNDPNDIIGTNNGTLMNGATYASGKVGPGFKFDGNNQYVEIPDSPSLRPVSGLTLDGWFEFDSGGQASLISKPFSSGNANSYVIWLQSGQLRAGIGGQVVAYSFSPVPGQWYHVAYTYDDVTMQHRLIIDGVTVDSRIYDSDLTYDSSPLLIGIDEDGGAPTLQMIGMADEVELFGRALSEAEVQAIHNAGSLGMCKVQCSTPLSGMISWWSAENNANDRLGRNNAVMQGEATFEAGKVGQAFSFDGSGDFAQVVTTSSLPVGASPRTVELWFRTPNNLSSQTESGIFQYGSASNGNMFGLVTSLNAPGKLYFYGNNADLAGTTTLLPNTWYHGAVTYDGTTVKLYVNGQLENQAPIGLNTILDSNGLTIGHRPGGAFWTGQIDEPTLYDRALSPDEIGAIYNAGNSGKCHACAGQPADLISWWRGEGNVNDAVGGNYGVLLGGATFATGAVGRAFSFNGTTASVRIPDSPTLDVTTEFTLGAWIKPNSIPVYPNGALVMSKVGPIGNLNGYQMAVSNISGTNKIWCGFNTSGGNWPQYSATGGNVPVGEWTYIACTYDHNTLAVHQNGIQVGSSEVGPVTVANTSSNLKLGSDDVAQQFYSGLIDEPMVFGRALSSVELLAFYHAGGIGVCQTANPTSPGCASIPPGMISWWRGEGNALDRRKAHHGTLAEGPVFTTGKVGKAFVFAAGNEAVDAGTWFNLQTFSIETWVKPNNGQILYANIIDNYHSSSPLRSWVLEDLNAGNIFQWYSADFPAGANILFELVPDTWQHIVITRDANRVTRGYLNRSLVGTMTTSSDIPYDGTEHLRIGNWYGGNRAFNGMIDEVTIYGRSLDESEIASLYSAGSYGKCVGTQTMADMDGDMLSDLSIFRPSGSNGSEWWWLKSTGGNSAVQFGVATDTLVASDYTGDGKTDVAFWRPSTGEWYILRSEDSSFYAFPFGASGDIPAPADYDGDGKADPAVFRASSSTWYIQNSGGGTTIVQFGAAGDKPVPEDYDGDGKADIAVFRPNGTGGAEWWIARSSGGVFATQFGQATDRAVPADYTGDGKADIAFWTPSNGYWYILRSDDLSYYAFPFGTSSDIAVPGDYDGDGKADPGVFRPSNSNWYISRSTAGTLIQQFGTAGDVPVPNEFVR